MKSQNKLHTTNTMNAGLGRRLGSLLYDSLLLMAIGFLVTCAYVAIVLFITEQPNLLENPQLLQTTLFPLLLLTTAFFYAWFWSRHGRTLGMQTWRMKVLSLNGGPLSNQQIAVRLITGFAGFICGGIGFWWVLFDKNNSSLHDKLSRTTVIVTPP